MSLENKLSNTNETQEIINNNQKVESVAVSSAEDIKTKEEVKAQSRIDDNKEYEKIKNELMGGKNSEISGSEAYDIYSKWKETELKKIEIKAKEMEGQKVSVGIGYNYNRQFNSMNLESGGEIKFIEFASEEGNSRDIEAALKLLSIYHKDRDDLKEELLKKLEGLENKDTNETHYMTKKYSSTNEGLNGLAGLYNDYPRLKGNKMFNESTPYLGIQTQNNEKFIIQLRSDDTFYIQSGEDGSSMENIKSLAEKMGRDVESLRLELKENLSK